MDKPFVSFITVCYNGYSDTCELIDSIHELIHSVRYEIIVVDNASKEDEASKIQGQYADVVTIRSKTNLGFAGGNNMGIKASHGDYLFFINNDTFFEQDELLNLVARLTMDEETAGVSPLIRYADGERPIQFAGYSKLSPITMRNHALGWGQTDLDGLPCCTTPYLHGAAMLFKRSAIKEVGMMPEFYFLYYEEYDWCCSFTRAGYKLWFENRCTVFHKESRSTGKSSPLRTFYLTRNRMLLAWHHAGPVCRILSIIYQIVIADTKSTLVYLVQRRPDLVKSVWKGVHHFFSMHPKIQDNPPLI